MMERSIGEDDSDREVRFRDGRSGASHNEEIWVRMTFFLRNTIFDCGDESGRERLTS
jgi:hypothetical protein